jgi:class 3 adenylate cyclase
VRRNSEAATGHLGECFGIISEIVSRTGGIETAALAALLREVTERPLYAYVARSNVASILLDAATYHAIAANHPDAEHHHLELKGKAAPVETFAIRVR